VTSALIGKKLGKYHITSLLGQGGMATVYVGHQADIDRNVAIKVLPPHPGQDSRFVDRFQLEARTVARLQHPHIMPLYDYGDEDGILYLIMPYVTGGSLADRLRKGNLSISDAERLLNQIGGALDYAHRQNIVHRDIKPANILLDREGNALLMDFGIVKLLEVSSSQLTGTGGMIGTPAYMSPEQAQGLDVDTRSDLYSLAVVAYEMLTGKQPFVADTPMQIVLKQISAPPPLDMLNAPFARVLGRALSKMPDDRYTTAAEFLADFSRAARGDMVTLPPAQSTILYNDATLNVPATGMMPPTGTLPPTGMMPPTGTGAYPASGTFGTYAPQPTIITQQSTNPLVLLGGFAIIAILIVVVVILLVSAIRPPVDSFIPLPAQIAAQATIDALNGTVTPLTPAPPTARPTVVVAPSLPSFGRVSFGTSASAGDTVDVRVDDLIAPADGQSYGAWLFNSETEAALLLGILRLDALGAGAISYTSTETAPLFSQYNALLITAETTPGDIPSATVAYSGSFPMSVTAALSEILISSPDGLPVRNSDQLGSLVAGAQIEADVALQHSGLAARATTLPNVQTHAEHTINVLRGQLIQEDLNGNGRAENPGRGIGIFFFLDAIEAQLEIIATQGEGAAMQSQSELIRVCILNVRNWTDIVIDNEFQLLAATDIATTQPQKTESTFYTEAIIEGIDLNDNGQVEAFEGECGLNQISDYGVSVSNFVLRAGGL